MRASQVLQKCLPDSLGRMHALRERVLLRAVEALLSGRRLTLTDVARSLWLDRLSSLPTATLEQMTLVV